MRFDDFRLCRVQVLELAQEVGELLVAIAVASSTAPTVTAVEIKVAAVAGNTP